MLSIIHTQFLSIVPVMSFKHLFFCSRIQSCIVFSFYVPLVLINWEQFLILSLLTRHWYIEVYWLLCILSPISFVWYFLIIRCRYIFLAEIPVKRYYVLRRCVMLVCPCVNDVDFGHIIKVESAMFCTAKLVIFSF